MGKPGKSKEIIKADLVRKQKRIHALIFKGYWDIKDKTRLYYCMDKKSDSAFAFQTGVVRLPPVSAFN